MEYLFSEVDIRTLLRVAMSCAPSPGAAPSKARTLVELSSALQAEAAAARQFELGSGKPTHEIRWGSVAAFAELDLTLRGALDAAGGFEASAGSLTRRGDQPPNEHTWAQTQEADERRKVRTILSVHRDATCVVCAAIRRGDDQPPFSDPEVGIAGAIFGSACWITGPPLVNDSTSSSSLPLRARQVLKLLEAGCAEKEIASQLAISPHAVHSHVKRIYCHYRVGSRVELISLLLRRLFS